MSEEQVSFLYAIVTDQNAKQEHLDRWLVPALRQVDYGEIADVIVKLRAELAQAREALLNALTAMEKVATPNDCWEYATEYGPYGSHYVVKWTDSGTPEYILENAIAVARAILPKEADDL